VRQIIFLQTSALYLASTNIGRPMNKHQRLILALGFFSILLMGVFPPWVRSDRNHVSRPGGYSFFLQEPRRPVDNLLANSPVEYRVDFSQLTLQWTLMLVMMGIVLLFVSIRRDALENQTALKTRRA
jgi:hypothetical protein